MAPMPKESLQAFVFPGQGVQRVGMGANLLFHQNPDVARSATRTYEEADDTLKLKIKNLSLYGEQERLNHPGIAEPVILTASIAALRILKEREIQADMVAGHSLGEYSALVAAEALNFEQALRLVRTRGLLMEQAGKINPGKMGAVLGNLSLEDVERICQKSGAEIANINSPDQIVIAGRHESLDIAGEIVKIEKGKLVILKVNVASHSSLMEPTRDGMRGMINDEPISNPTLPIVMNLTADYASDISSVRRELVDQLTGRVLWLDTIRQIHKDGVGTFIDIGPGQVLANMIKKIEPSATIKISEEIIR